jgi:Flp pilus assembly protein TadG
MVAQFEKCPLAAARSIRQNTANSSYARIREKVFMIRRESRGGQAIILFVLALPVLFGMVGLAFDIGFLEMLKHKAQTAADAAAIAGAVDLPYGSMTTSARAASAVNGFTNGVNGASIVVNNPPSIGPHAGGSCSGGSPSPNCNYVEVVVSQPEPTFFLRMVGAASSTPVAARAVAYNTAGDCVFALNPTMSGALTLLIGAINTPNCAVIVDSNDPSAVSGFLAFVTARQIGIVGNYSGCFLCFFNPNPVTGIAPESDPLAYLPAPTVGACPVTVKTISSGSVTLNPSLGCYNVNITGNANVTFMPGEYSAIAVNSGAAPTLTFQPGTYVIQGSGGLSLGGNGSTVTGNGVTFYLGPSAGGVSVNGVLNTMNLVAPTTGTYAAILFFQDRSNTHPACIGGCGVSLSGILQFLQVQGALYFPSAALSFTGCCQSSAGPFYTAYEITVADSLSLFFDYFNDDYSSLPGGSPIKRTLVVE